MNNTIGIIHHLREVFEDTLATSFILFRIMIPISIIVKILEYTGLITRIGMILSPFMQLLGLSGETGLVWATAMITNIYGGIIVFINLASEQMFTVAEATILGSMILIAHSLPVEVTIARKAGIRVWFTVLFRILSACLFGFILHTIFSILHVFETPSTMTWTTVPENASLADWVINQLRNYLLIFIIIFSLLLLMKLLKKLGIIDKLNQWMEPALEFLGLSKKAAPLTIIGTTLGISYGGGIIIKEARSGVLSRKDAFLSVSLMGLSHSLIEDTILMMTIGASIIGILFGRVLFSILIMIGLIAIIKRISQHSFYKYFTIKQRP
jgi:hypothetical protein